jgi:uncharacterized membrane protein
MIQYLKALFDPKQQYNEASWVWMGQWSLWISLSVIVLLLISLYLVWQNSAKLSNWQRRFIFVLRFLSAVFLFLLFLQPAIRLEDVTRVKNYIAVLVDQSLSMSLPQSDEVQLEQNKNQIYRRIDQATDVLKSEAKSFEAWKQNHIIEYYGFSDHLSPLESQNFKADGQSTLLMNAFDELMTRHQPEELAGVVLLSDADDHSDLIPSGIKEIPTELKRAVSQLKVPVHTLTLGPLTEPKDIAIRHLKADDFAFTRNAVSVEVEIAFSAYQRNFDVPVRLLRDGILVTQKILHYENHQKIYPLTFEFVPQFTGEESFKIEIEPQANESVTENNHVYFSMKVIRDKIRALQVVGRPSWDEKFLRNHLKQNPNVDLISFFILRTNASIETADQSELSLIPFPTQELFEEQLGSFDLVIFQNFTYKGYRMKQYLPLIRDYVAQGGGFVMIGGDISFAGGDYAQTPIAEFLPVKLHHNGSDQIFKGEFKPILSQAGKTHPITALSLLPDENQKFWDQLPKLSGSNLHQGLKEGAISLVDRVDGDQKDSIINIFQFQQGRVMSIATDSMWKWAFDESQVGSRHFNKFWGNSIRWLIADPSLNPLKVKCDQDKYAENQEIIVTATLSSQDYQPLANESIELIFEEIERDPSRDLTDQNLGLSVDSIDEDENPFDLFNRSNRNQNTLPQRTEPKVKIVHQAKVTTQNQGEAIYRWKSDHAGAFRVRAQAKPNQTPLEAKDVFVVQSDPLELRSIHSRPDVMHWISKVSKGKNLEIGDSWDQLNFEKPKVMRVNKRQDIPLWSSSWMMILMLSILSLEWFLRRRWGLL